MKTEIIDIAFYQIVTRFFVLWPGRKGQRNSMLSDETTFWNFDFTHYVQYRKHFVAVLGILHYIVKHIRVFEIHQNISDRQFNWDCSWLHLNISYPIYIFSNLHYPGQNHADHNVYQKLSRRTAICQFTCICRARDIPNCLYLQKIILSQECNLHGIKYLKPNV